jgi:hypothetical protein
MSGTVVAIQRRGTDNQRKVSSEFKSEEIKMMITELSGAADLVDRCSGAAWLKFVSRPVKW